MPPPSVQMYYTIAGGSTGTLPPIARPNHHLNPPGHHAEGASAPVLISRKRKNINLISARESPLATAAGRSRSVELDAVMAELGQRRIGKNAHHRDGKRQRW